VLCQNRNKEALKKIQSLGISEAHIIKVLETKEVQTALKSSFFNLYKNLYLNVEPYFPLISYSNNNFILEKVIGLDFKETHLTLYNEVLDNSEQASKDDKSHEYILRKILDFWANGLD